MLGEPFGVEQEPGLAGQAEEAAPGRGGAHPAGWHQDYRKVAPHCPLEAGYESQVLGLLPDLHTAGLSSDSLAPKF